MLCLLQMAIDGSQHSESGLDNKGVPRLISSLALVRYKENESESNQRVKKRARCDSMRSRV